MTGVKFKRLYHVNIDVADLARAIDFYRSLGFEVVTEFAMTGETARRTCEALGAPAREAKAAFLRLGSDPSAPVLDLVEWAGADGMASLPRRPLRLAFEVEEPQAVLAALEARGVGLLGPVAYGQPAGGGRSTVFGFKDPDGNIIEVVAGMGALVE